MVHIPSLAAKFGIALPPAFQLGVVGGRQRGHDVFVDGHTTLLFYAKEAEPDASSDASSGHEDSSRPASPGPAGLAVHDPADVAFPPGPPPEPDGSAIESGEHQEVGMPVEGSHTTYWMTEDELIDFLQNGMPQPGTGEAPARLGSRNTEESDIGGDAPGVVRHVPVFVYIPDFVPEHHTVALSLPCSVSQLVSSVKRVRRTAGNLWFPNLSPVLPQPSLQYAAFVAVPKWPTEQALVLMDCSRVTGVTFAVAVSQSLNRESLLHAAGLHRRQDIAVYVHGLANPIAQAQLVTLVNGMMVTFVPGFEGAPIGHELATMLLQDITWDSDVEVPEISTTALSYFWVLTDAWAVLFEIAPDIRAEFRAELVEQLHVRDEVLTIQAAAPPITDLCIRGHAIVDVVVATEQLSRIPYPPARIPEHRHILIVDGRRVLRPFLWMFVEGDTVPVNQIHEHYDAHCPPGYTVRVLGVESFLREGSLVYPFEHGQLFPIVFRRQSEATGPVPFDETGPTGRLGDDADSRHAPPDDGGENGMPSSASRVRSRTPRPAVGLRQVGGPRGQLYGLTRDELDACARLNADLCQAITEPPTRSRLRQDHSSPPDNSVRITEDAMPQSEHPSQSDAAASLHGEVLSEADTAPTVADEPVMVQATFVVLTPGYAPEVLNLTVFVPQAIHEVLEVVQTCRDQHIRAFFPSLLPVQPQPDARWAVLLAVPTWPCVSVPVCLSLESFDERLFATHAPAVVDKALLLQLAGLAPVADVDVYPAGRDRPLSDGEDIILRPGHCISFLPVPNRPANPKKLRIPLLGKKGFFFKKAKSQNRSAF